MGNQEELRRQLLKLFILLGCVRDHHLKSAVRALGIGFLDGMRAWQSLMSDGLVFSIVSIDGRIDYVLSERGHSEYQAREENFTPRYPSLLKWAVRSKLLRFSDMFIDILWCVAEQDRKNGNAAQWLLLERTKVHRPNALTYHRDRKPSGRFPLHHVVEIDRHMTVLIGWESSAPSDWPSVVAASVELAQLERAQPIIVVEEDWDRRRAINIAARANRLVDEMRTREPHARVVSAAEIGHAFVGEVSGSVSATAA